MTILSLQSTGRCCHLRTERKKRGKNALKKIKNNAATTSKDCYTEIYYVFVLGFEYTVNLTNALVKENDSLQLTYRSKDLSLPGYHAV